MSGKREGEGRNGGKKGGVERREAKEGRRGKGEEEPELCSNKLLRELILPHG